MLALTIKSLSTAAFRLAALTEHIFDGGFTLTFSVDQQMYGDFGRSAGRAVGGIEYINYGFYAIAECPQSPVVIQHQSAIPVHQEPTDGTNILKCDLYN